MSYSILFLSLPTSARSTIGHLSTSLWKLVRVIRYVTQFYIDVLTERKQPFVPSFLASLLQYVPLRSMDTYVLLFDKHDNIVLCRI